MITSFKTLPDSVKLTIIPQPFTLEAYQYAFTKLDPPLPRLFLNSAIIAVAVTLTNLVLGSMAGYAFARLRFPGREVLFLIVLATLMIPDQLRLVPGLPGPQRARASPRASLQYGGVILVLAISATSIFLMRQFFLSIPRELEEAAQDRWRRLLHDVLAGDAAAGRTGPRGRRDPASSRAPGTASSGR